MHENGSEPVPMVQEVCVWLAEKMEKIGWIVKKKKRKNEKNKNKKTLHPGLFSWPNGKSCSCHFLLPLNHFFFGRSYPSYEYTKEEFAHEGPLSRLVTTTHPSNPFNKVDKWSSRPKKLCKRADHSKFIFVN